MKSSEIGNSIALPFSVAGMKVDEIFPFPPGELDEEEFTHRTCVFVQRMIAQTLAEQFDPDPPQEGALLCLLPTDDPAMVRMSLERAMRIEAGGGRVNLRIIQPTKTAAT